MRPPECAICGKDFDINDKAGLINFKKRFSDQAWVRKMMRTDSVGHPPYAEWFCEEHYPRAKELEGKTIDKAMEILRNEEELKKSSKN